MVFGVELTDWIISGLAAGETDYRKREEQSQEFAEFAESDVFGHSASIDQLVREDTTLPAFP